MDFPLNKLPVPKYMDKPEKHKETKKPVIVKNIDDLFTDKFIKKYFSEHKKTNQ